MTENAFVLARAEWARVCERPDALETVWGWLVEAGVPIPRGAAVGGLDELLRRLKRGGGQAFSDQWLGVLLERVLEGSELAAWVVVEAMSPSAMKSVRRLCLRYVDVPLDEVAQAALTSLYEVVRRYPLERRRRKIALNISMDTYHLASRELGRQETPFLDPREGPAVLDEQDEDHPVFAAARSRLAAAAVEVGLGDVVGDLSGARGELVELLIWALRERLLDQGSVRVLTDHYREGALGDVEAARVAGVSAVALRKRRSRTVRQLREVAPLWLAQAA